MQYPAGIGNQQITAPYKAYDSNATYNPRTVQNPVTLPPKQVLVPRNYPPITPINQQDYAPQNYPQGEITIVRERPTTIIREVSPEHNGSPAYQSHVRNPLSYIQPQFNVYASPRNQNPV